MKSSSRLSRRMIRNDAALCIFAKKPVPGEVKTRLGDKIGMDEAARIYEELLRLTLRRMAKDNGAWDSYLCFAPSEAAGWFERLKEEFGVSGIMEQAAGDLGERMLTCIKQTLACGYSKVILIGTDCPGLTPEIVGEAVVALDTSQVVLGPAEDGGYYLIGATHPVQRIFEDIAWSTPEVFPKTIERLREMGVNFSCLGKLSDIDQVDDLKLLPDEIKSPKL